MARRRSGSGRRHYLQAADLHRQTAQLRRSVHRGAARRRGGRARRRQSDMGFFDIFRIADKQPQRIGRFRQGFRRGDKRVRRRVRTAIQGQIRQPHDRIAHRRRADRLHRGHKAGATVQDGRNRKSGREAGNRALLVRGHRGAVDKDIGIDAPRHGVGPHVAIRHRKLVHSARGAEARDGTYGRAGARRHKRSGRRFYRLLPLARRSRIARGVGGVAAQGDGDDNRYGFHSGFYVDNGPRLRSAA